MKKDKKDFQTLTDTFIIFNGDKDNCKWDKIKNLVDWQISPDIFFWLSILEGTLKAPPFNFFLTPKRYNKPPLSFLYGSTPQGQW